MNLQQLKYAQALAELGSFVRAAEQCHITQPTLSNAIAQLELDLGHKLFERTTRTVRLTEIGQQLLPDICDLLNAQAALVARAKSLANPTARMIRLGVSPLIGVKLADLAIEPFRRANSDVEIIFRELNLFEMVRLLDQGQLDFVLGPADPTAVLSMHHQSAFFHDEALVFVPGSQSRGRYFQQSEVTLKEIAGETFVMVPDACGLTRTTRALFGQLRLSLREYSGQAMSYSVLQEWAELGIGSAILPQSKLASGAEGLPRIRAADGSPVRIRYQSLWRGAPEPMADVTALAVYLRDVAPALVAGLSP
ncbi:MAG TPA: LysR family transcriptional regulator [Albidovulum sp.]|uniref:LysR family transcriptional regulator n=1 Tax=Albidovulum sp. TaxID=1872424 RepID=UPI002C40F4E7|nr:LysR family transcriptional regulator [Albidovulum sp.]